MKKILMGAMLFITGTLAAQNIEIVDFNENTTNLTARTMPIEDRNGDPCAVIRFLVSETDFVIMPNMGSLKTITQPGMILVYVPQGTKRITISKNGVFPLVNYEIPMQIKQSTTYDATVIIKISEQAQIKTEKVKPVKKVKTKKARINGYIGLGYNIMSINGPIAELGLDMKHFYMELNYTYGIDKSGIYSGNNSRANGLISKVMRLELQAGYKSPLNDFLSVSPQAGIAYNFFYATNANTLEANRYNGTFSFSGLVGLRFIASFNKVVKFQVTPKYHFGIAKEKVYKMIEDNCDMKKWTEGFNLDIGLLFFF